MYFLGLDPGGIKAFGWAICKIDKNQIIKIKQQGVCNEANEAINQVLDWLADTRAMITAIGIDAPLFWSKARASTGVETWAWGVAPTSIQLCSSSG